MLVAPPVLPPVDPPVLGEVGDFGVVALPEELPPIEPDEEPDPVELLLEPEGLLVLPLLELEPDLLKWASHSAREIVPSLLASTDEKLGWDWLPELELGEVVLDDVPPLADGEADDGLDDEEEESAAAAASDRAKSAAAVVTVTVLIME